MLRPPPTSTLFPYTTLFRSVHASEPGRAHRTFKGYLGAFQSSASQFSALSLSLKKTPRFLFMGVLVRVADRKSTRLNSSHPSISYAVFCLKKKNNSQQQRPH